MLNVSNPANFISLPENLDNLEKNKSNVEIKDFSQKLVKRSLSLKRAGNHQTVVLNIKSRDGADSGLWSANEESCDIYLNSAISEKERKSSKNNSFSSVKKSKSKIKETNLLPKKSMKEIDQRFDMPSLIELNESSKSEQDVPSCSIVINECDNLHNDSKKFFSENTASSSNLSQNDLKTNIFEYFFNNQKNFNTKSAIASIATAAANSDLDGNFAFGSNNQTFLQTLLMDLIQPPLAVSSQFDLSSTASTDPIDIDLSLNVYQNQGDVFLNNTQVSGPKQIDINQTFNNSFNSNYMNLNKKQINDQIMRTCMGYLDYINQKHTRERRIQTIRNKISGFILLTTVFLIIFGLAVLVFVSLTNVLASSTLGKLNRTVIVSSTNSYTNNTDWELLKYEIDYFLRNVFIRTNTTKVSKEKYGQFRKNLFENLLKIIDKPTKKDDIYFDFALPDLQLI